MHFPWRCCQTAGEWTTIYPWIHSNCNSLSGNDQLRPVSIPDIHPARAVQELLKGFPSVEVTLLKSTVIQTKKVDDLIEAGANLRAKLGLHPRTSNK
ncbi:carnosine N-methyltransferase [Trifolium repens]|nr:carnosine N-methyltransferase [Trifolium repens]